MKYLFVLTIIIISNCNLKAQNLENCGLDKNPYLNSDESEFLNKNFSDLSLAYHTGKKAKNYDFTGKKMIFVTGSSGKTIKTKIDYFNSVKEYKKQDDKIVTTLLILTPEEKELSGGYDGILTFWVKVLPNKRKIIRKL